MSRIILGISAILLLCQGGCGYQLQGRGEKLPDEVRTLYVEMMENRTYEPFLENMVTNAVVERFARNPHLEIVEDRNRADAILSGEVVGYGNGAISYTRTDGIAEYRSTLVLSATLRKGDDATALWKGTVRWAEEYETSADKTLQDARESAAIELVSERLADELYSRIVDNF